MCLWQGGTGEFPAGISPAPKGSRRCLDQSLLPGAQREHRRHWHNPSSLGVATGLSSAVTPCTFRHSAPECAQCRLILARTAKACLWKWREERGVVCFLCEVEGGWVMLQHRLFVSIPFRGTGSLQSLACLWGQAPPHWASNNLSCSACPIEQNWVWRTQSVVHFCPWPASCYHCPWKPMNCSITPWLWKVTYSKICSFPCCE